MFPVKLTVAPSAPLNTVPLWLEEVFGLQIRCSVNAKYIKRNNHASSMQLLLIAMIKE